MLVLSLIFLEYRPTKFVAFNDLIRLAIGILDLFSITTK
jgi:hypothetical protein